MNNNKSSSISISISNSNVSKSNSNSNSNNNGKKRKVITVSSAPSVALRVPPASKLSASDVLAAREKDFVQQEQCALKLCGTCHQSLSDVGSTIAAPQVAVGEVGLGLDDKESLHTQSDYTSSSSDYRIITCANYLKDPNTCQTHLINRKTHTSLTHKKKKHRKYDDHDSNILLSSPRFHFCCTGIPQKSSLYYKLHMELEKEAQKKQKRMEQRKAKTGDINYLASISNSKGTRSANSSLSSSPVPFHDVNSIPKIAVSQFLCPPCNMKGTSMYLYEYFSKFHEMKSRFFNDPEAILSIQPVGYVTDNDTDCYGMGEDNGFVRYLIDQQLQKHSCVDSLPPCNQFQQKQYKDSEIRLHHIRNILSHVSTSSTQKQNVPILANYFVGQPVRLFCSISNTYHTGRSVCLYYIFFLFFCFFIFVWYISSKSFQRTLLFRIIASKVVDIEDLNRLKSSTKDSYKSNFRKKDDKGMKGNIDSSTRTRTLLLDKDIGRTIYLLRFRAGIEGRKIPVHEWIFLEEHPIMIGMSIVWVNTDILTNHAVEKCDTPSPDCSLKGKRYNQRNNIIPFKYKPMQLFVRSALEMAMVDEINNFSHFEDVETNKHIDSSTHISITDNVAGVFFGRSFQCEVLHLGPKADIMNQCSSPTSQKTNIIDKVSTALETCVNGLLSTTKQFSSPQSSSPKRIKDIIDKKGKGEEKKDCDENKLSKESTSPRMSHPSIILADFQEPCEQFQSILDDSMAQDELLSISIALAVMEVEEQNRVKNSKH